MTATFCDADDFDALRRLICRQTGIWLSDTKQTFLQVRLEDRLQTCNISSAREYYHFLRFDPRGEDEMQHLIDAVTVNETWFFRETATLEGWRDEALPELLWSGASNGHGQVRAWVAGCSTGEEAYTLAMLLLAGAAAERVEILATDINSRALETARGAVYDPHSVRHTDPLWVSRYFDWLPDGRLALREPVRTLVHFGRANLIEPTLSRRVEAVDVILCRNVLMYFDAEHRRAALANLYAALRPGGLLILGHSEVLAQAMTPFELARVAGMIMYRKGWQETRVPDGRL
jgi:chemotaxis protein methyltransferase CheR